MKPIEKGCMAIIVNSKAGHTGKFVVVGEFVGKVVGWRGDRRWETDRVLPGVLGTPTNTMQEHQLMRIDGYKEEIKQESKKIAV